MKNRLLILFGCLFFCDLNFAQISKIYIDTLEQKPYEFFVKNTKFRLKLKIEESLVLIEKFESKWIKIDSADFNQTIFLKDLNNDDFVDIGFYHKWISEVWMFNPQKKIFVYSGDFPIVEFQEDVSKIILLDNKLKVYYSYKPYKRGLWTSELYMIKNYKKKLLAYIHNYTNYSKQQDKYVTESITIMKMINEQEKAIKEISKQNIKSFDYAAYWKKNWQKFLAN